jgi:hypothetical protein
MTFMSNRSKLVKILLLALLLAVLMPAAYNRVMVDHFASKAAVR